MPSRVHSCFAVPIFDQWLLHAPLHSVSAVCGEGLLVALSDGLPVGTSGKTSVLMQALSQRPSPEPQPRTGTFSPDFLGLIPTRACNLACRYCAFGALDHAQTTMDPSMAVDAVQWMADTVVSQQRDCLAIDFFGGEPMVAPQVVDAVVQATHRSADRWGVGHRIEMATNGYYSAILCDSVARNIDYVVLSLDGPPEIHDLHRPIQGGQRSYDVVAGSARRLAAGPTHLTIRVCVTQASLKSLAENAGWFCREFHPRSLNVEPLRPTPQSSQAGLEPPDPWEFAAAVHEATRRASAYGIPVIHAPACVDHIRGAFCPLGKDVPIVSPDGQVSACYMQKNDWQSLGLDLSLGHWHHDGHAFSPDEQTLTRIRTLSQPASICRKCFCCWHCAGGCLINLHNTQRKDELNPFCVQTRILSACRLLDRLGNSELADRLARDRDAQAKLVHHASDLLKDWQLADMTSARWREPNAARAQDHP